MRLIKLISLTQLNGWRWAFGPCMTHAAVCKQYISTGKVPMLPLLHSSCGLEWAQSLQQKTLHQRDNVKLQVASLTHSSFCYCLRLKYFSISIDHCVCFIKIIFSFKMFFLCLAGAARSPYCWLLFSRTQWVSPPSTNEFTCILIGILMWGFLIDSVKTSH